MEEISTKISLKELFFGFTSIALKGFGGVSPYVYQELVVERKWIDAKEFTELVSICQILPGANVTNFSAIFGYRMKGYKGALAATAGMIFPPFVVLFIIYHFFKEYSQHSIVQGSLKGILAVASALILTTAYNMIKTQDHKHLASFMALACLFLVLYLKFSLILVLIILIPIGFFIFWRTEK